MLSDLLHMFIFDDYILKVHTSRKPDVIIYDLLLSHCLAQ